VFFPRVVSSPREQTGRSAHNSAAEPDQADDAGGAEIAGAPGTDLELVSGQG